MLLKCLSRYLGYANLFQALSSRGTSIIGIVKYFSSVRGRLDTDKQTADVELRSNNNNNIFAEQEGSIVWATTVPEAKLLVPSMQKFLGAMHTSDLMIAVLLEPVDAVVREK